MKRTLRLPGYVLALYAVETLLCTVFLEIEYYGKALQGHYDWGYRQALRDALEMNLVLAPATLTLWFRTFAVYMTIATFISPFVLRKFRP
ncbi:MAG TPA: hypothetical protein VGC22_08380 [Chitinophaga sp.]